MALPIRPNSGAQPRSTTKAVTRPLPKEKTVEEISLPSFDELVETPPQPVKKAPVKRPIAKPVPVVTAPEPEPEEDDELEEGWAIDEKTGAKYKTIPKSVYQGKGKNAVPLLMIEEFDVDNMTGEAETYLSHLRIPPNKQEQAELLRLRAELRKRSDASYEAANRDEIEKPQEEPEEKSASKVSFFQKLTSLFR
jgi:hypothetical protein